MALMFTLATIAFWRIVITSSMAPCNKGMVSASMRTPINSQRLVKV